MVLSPRQRVISRVPEGFVIGTVSWISKKDQYNGAKMIDAMCSKILTCDGEYYWEW